MSKFKYALAAVFMVLLTSALPAWADYTWKTDVEGDFTDVNNWDRGPDDPELTTIDIDTLGNFVIDSGKVNFNLQQIHANLTVSGGTVNANSFSVDSFNMSDGTLSTGSLSIGSGTNSITGGTIRVTEDHIDGDLISAVPSSSAVTFKPVGTFNPVGQPSSNTVNIFTPSHTSFNSAQTGSCNLVLDGGIVLSIPGDVSLTGTTTITDGMLRLEPDSSNVLRNYTLNNVTITKGWLVFVSSTRNYATLTNPNGTENGTIQLNQTQLTVNCSSDSDISCKMRGATACSITKTGNAKLTLGLGIGNSNSPCPGNITINSGMLELGADSTLEHLFGSENGILNTNGKTITLKSGNYSGKTIGSGSIIKTAERLTLILEAGLGNSNSSFNGTTTISSGTLQLGADSTLYNLTGGTEDAPVTMNAINATNAGQNLTINTSGEEAKLFVGSITAKEITVNATEDAPFQVYTAANGAVRAESFVVSSGRVDVKGCMEGVIDGEGIDVTVDGGVFSPGNSVGTVEVTGDVAITSNGIALFEFSSYSEGKHDELIINGDGTFTAAASTIQLYFESDISDWATEGSKYKLVSNGGFTEDYDYSSWLYNYGDLFELKGGSDGLYLISTKVAPDPNAVPEPSTWALLILGAAGLMYVRKRTRK